MKIEWEHKGREHVARVGAWTLEAWTGLDGKFRGAVSLEGAAVLSMEFKRIASIDEAKAAVERWVLEYVAPFVEAAVAAEREACAEIADEYFVRRVGVPAAIAERIRARGDGAK